MTYNGYFMLYLTGSLSDKSSPGSKHKNKVDLTTSKISQTYIKYYTKISHINIVFTFYTLP